MMVAFMHNSTGPTTGYRYTTLTNTTTVSNPFFKSI